MPSLTIEQWPLSKFIDYENNPRKNEHVVDKMCAAIDEVGFKVPIIATSDGQVVDGHLRLKAARQLDLETVPVVLADDLSDTQIKAFRIMINQSAHWADWDMDLLKLEIQSLNELDFDLNLIGFADDELDALLTEEKFLEETDEEALPEPPEVPVSQPGDLWQLGKHRLLCGDALNRSHIDKLMVGDRAAMAFTDPPYNIDYGNNARDTIRGKKRHVINDSLGNNFHQFLQIALTHLLAVTEGSCYVCMASSELDTLRSAFREAGGKWSSFIIWAKNHFAIGGSDYQRQYEPILYGWREGADRFWCGARDQSDVWSIDKPVKNDLHPTMKPVQLVERAICNSSQAGKIVLDVFAGSGSTLIACEQTNRQGRLMEIEPKYVDVIIKRWQVFTGKQALQVGDGLAFDNLSASGQRQKKILN